MSFIISFMEIVVLSSNTKKGEIERAFPSIRGFVVNDNILGGLIMCLSFIDLFEDDTRQFDAPQK
jgi:hypothetical protein